MTVCVAALADMGKIAIAASDRMITYGEGVIEGERYETKHVWLAPHVLGMLSGHFPTIKRLLVEVQGEVAARSKSEAEATVKDVADTYGRLYVARHQHEAQRVVLAPYGLTFETFISEQQTMAESFVADLTEMLGRFRLPAVECLIVGTDATGCHVYQAAGGSIECCDSPGFAAVGIGASHAASHMIQQGYGRQFFSDECLMHVLLAKKRAETAAGVGTSLDLVIFGPGREHRPTIHDDKTLASIYSERERTLRSIDAGTRARVNKFMRDNLGIPLDPFPPLKQNATTRPDDRAAPQSPRRSTDDSSLPPASQD